MDGEIYSGGYALVNRRMQVANVEAVFEQRPLLSGL